MEGEIAHLANDGSPALAFPIPAIILIAAPCSHPLIIADTARKRGPELLGLLQFLLDISNLIKRERERENTKTSVKTPNYLHMCLQSMSKVSPESLCSLKRKMQIFGVAKNLFRLVGKPK